MRASITFFVWIPLTALVPKKSRIGNFLRKCANQVNPFGKV